MIENDQDIHHVLRHLVDSARIIPDRGTGSAIVVLDLHTYMNIEDAVSRLEHKESPHEPNIYPIPQDVILGSTIR